MKTGVYRGMGREEYERIDRCNWSRLKYLRRSPAHYRAAHTAPDEDTDAKRVGRATHVAVLEPERFRASYAVWDGGRRYGKEWDKFREKNGHLEILTEEQYQTVTAIAEAVLSHEHAAKHLRGGSAEVTILWTDPGTGIECKGRLDLLQRAITDLKTCRDASPEAFARQAWNLSYSAQAAMYVDGFAAASGTGELLPYMMVAVESTAPHVVQPYRVPEHVLEAGRGVYRHLLERLAECRKENRWPGYADGELDLELPRWAQAQNDEDDSMGLGLVVNQ